MKVLVVDDDYWTRIITIEALVCSGITAVEASSGAEAIELATREKPDCVLLDFLLPDCEGTSVLKDLQALDSPPPVVFVTTLLDEAQRSNLLESGAAAVLCKPIDLPGLARLLEQTVGGDTS